MSEVFGAGLPAHWSTTRLKSVVTYLRRGMAPDYVEKGDVRAISQAANQDDGLDWARTRFHKSDGPPADLKGHLKTGDILINSTGTGTLGRVGFFEGAPDGIPCLADSHITIARADNTTADSRYIYYWLRSKPLQEYIYVVLAVGATNQIELNREGLANAPFPVPPLEEQRRIAGFLDLEIGKLDALIHKKRQLISLMTERIDSKILSHVGKSQLVNMRTGTTALPLRRTLMKVFRPPAAEVDVITAYRDGQVTARSLRRAEGYTLSASTEPQGQYVRVDDVVIHGLDGFAGAIGTSEATGNCSPVYHVCIPRAGGNAKFLGRLLRLLALQGYLGNFATSTRERAVDFRNWDLFGRIPIPIVSNEEQRAIGELINNIRPLRGAVERSEVVAAERRQALITAAVTGQFDVSSASGRGLWSRA